MKIWIVNHYAVPPSHGGGTRHYNLAQELSKKGHEVFIIASNFSHFSYDFIGASQKLTKTPEKIERVNFCWIPTPKYRKNSIKRLWNMLVFSLRILQKKYLSNIPRPDLIIGSSPHLFAAFSAYLIAKRHKIPFVLEVRDIWPESLILLGNISRKHPLMLLMTWIERFLYHNAQTVITLLPQAEKHIKKYRDNAQIYWLPNFVDISAANITTNNLAKTNKEIFKFMYAGTHGLANNLEAILQSASILQKNSTWKNKIRIAFVGDGPNKQNLIEQATREQISNVEFLDAVSKAEIYNILATADAFIMPLKDSPVFQWGISPNKLFDYMLMEKPIVFCINSSHNPIEESKSGITISPDDPTAIAQAMQQIANLPIETRQKMGQRAKKYVIENHSLVNIATQLEKVLLSTYTEFQKNR